MHSSELVAVAPSNSGILPGAIWQELCTIFS